MTSAPKPKTDVDTVDKKNVLSIQEMASMQSISGFKSKPDTPKDTQTIPKQEEEVYTSFTQKSELKQTSFNLKEEEKAKSEDDDYAYDDDYEEDDL